MNGRFEKLLHEKGDRLQVADIKSLVAAEAADLGKRYRRLRRSLYPGLASAAVGLVWREFLPSCGEFCRYVQAILVMGGLILCLWPLLELLVTSRDDIRLARRALHLFGGQDSALDHVMTRSRTGPGVALFLRSFDAEDEGASDLEYFANRMGDVSIEGARHDPRIAAIMSEPNTWADQLRIIKLIRRRIPVAMMDNITSSNAQRSELKRGRVNLVPVVIGDWRPAFMRLFEASRFVVVFCGAATSSLEWEMNFLASAGKPYVIVTADPSSKERLPEQVCANAKLIVTSSEVEKFNQWLMTA